MAAFAALVSVMQIIDQIQHHPRPPISLHKQHVDSLTANLTFLQQFLESYNPHVSYTTEADPLESRIAEAAYAAEDVIESYIVDQILAPSTDHFEEIGHVQFHQTLQKVIEEIDLIRMEVAGTKEKKRTGVQIKKSTGDAGSLTSPSIAKKVNVVGLDGVLYEMLEKMVGGADRRVIPIVGMGGLGKTTLARSIYTNPLIKEHFDVCAWSTISQVYSGTKILKEILGQVDMEDRDRGDLSEYDLGEELYRYLTGRRYFVVMDDMWSIEAWDRVSQFFPDNENGSRIVVTTRLSKLASMLNYSNGIEMEFLDEATSWDLFSQTVFGDGVFPPELEDIGKKILKGCKGLPLSIVVIGGLLSKSEPSQENWKLIEENLYSIVNLENDESCLQILYTSYNNLPVRIKPCFLCMGINGEDEDIPVSLLIPLWVAEGFIRPVDGKSLEEVGEEYLEELVDRNLVLVDRRNRYGKLKSCKIHDLLRDVCLREIQKHRFLCVLGEHNIPRDTITSLRRVSSENPPTQLFQSLESASLVRCLIGSFPEALSTSFRLLRVFAVKPFDDEEESSRDWSSERKISDYYEDIFVELVNLRLLFVGVDDQHPLSVVPYSGSFLWNLQTLYLDNIGDDFVLEIWKMPQLRHVMTYDGSLDGAYCLSPLTGDMEEEVVLENLQTLFVVNNLSLGEEVLKRIPNIKKLKLDYYESSTREDEDEEEGDCFLNNMHKLESLCIFASFGVRRRKLITFPRSLKKLRLENTGLPWEEMASRIGCLPHLQVLKLKQFSCTGSEWETVEGHFSSLKFLMIERCDLENWITENAHFPRLEHLVLRFLRGLREIPSSIGDIATLRSIKLEGCRDDAVKSARRIVEEQEELGNEDLQVHVI